MLVRGSGHFQTERGELDHHGLDETGPSGASPLIVTASRWLQMEQHAPEYHGLIQSAK